jgi:hypothetical protein
MSPKSRLPRKSSGLEREGHLVADETTGTGWRVVDPLLEQWLANGRSWPESA